MGTQAALLNMLEFASNPRWRVDHGNVILLCPPKAAQHSGTSCLTVRPRAHQYTLTSGKAPRLTMLGKYRLMEPSPRRQLSMHELKVCETLNMTERQYRDMRFRWMEAARAAHYRRIETDEMLERFKKL